MTERHRLAAPCSEFLLIALSSLSGCLRRTMRHLRHRPAATEGHRLLALPG
ncbi:hypothetical protein [Nocardiopsis alkaliphila]|uniref:hypothetical protein n=1 Tax=Nocardiopsis alkaliphila TaxID=225762 RepID=UPI0013771878|nr:hypothetical protein [Nocardiopsis alkaliphila]